MNRLGKGMLGRWRKLPGWAKGVVAGVGLIGGLGCGYIGIIIYSQFQSNSVPYIRRWFNEPANRVALITTQQEPCPGAPFLLPSSGLIGLLWNDPAGPYSVLHRHSGIDIFGNGAAGTIPVYAAYAGYLTRLDNWVSAVIIQHDDPLESGRVIWTYYAHMASQDGESYVDAAFPAGTRGKRVEQGTLLGYQGDYNGGSVRQIGTHLHFSVVLSEDNGTFKNETDAGNTLDPSPYLGMALHVDEMPERPIQCKAKK